MPAMAKAPLGPRATISSTWLASRSAGGLLAGELLADGPLADFAMALPSLGNQRAQYVHLCGQHRCAVVAPGDADVGHDGGHLAIIEDVRKRWHAVRPRILLRAGRIAA